MADSEILPIESIENLTVVANREHAQTMEAITSALHHAFAAGEASTRNSTSRTAFSWRYDGVAF